jgi:multidrug efflux pump subunit AcrB
MYKSILKTFINNHILGTIIIVMILAGGVIASFSMIKELSPPITKNEITVTVNYSDVSPGEIDESVCIKLDNALADLPGVKSIKTKAYDGYGVAVIECQDGYDLYKIKDSIQTQLDGITDFPEKAEKPIVQIVKHYSYVITVNITGDLPEDQLRDFAVKFNRKLNQLPGVSNTEFLSKVSNPKINIEISEKNLKKYNLTFAEVKKAIEENNVSAVAGKFNTKTEDFTISAFGRKYRAKDYRNIPIISKENGTVVKLGWIADIHDSNVLDNGEKYFMVNEKEKPIIKIYINTTGNNDAIKISRTVEKFVIQEQKKLPPTIIVTTGGSDAPLLTQTMNSLLANGLVGILLVIILLWLFIDMKLSLWVAFSIPVSMAGAFIVMAFTGVSINMISLFSLIMVVGIIVDDGIVISESIHEMQRDGKPTIKNVIAGAKRVAWPVVAAVTTTMLAFVPLLFIPGSMGQLLNALPIVVISSLAFSLFEGLFILPAHLKKIDFSENKQKKGILKCLQKTFSNGLDKLIQFVYDPVIKKLISYRYTASAVGFILCLIVTGLVSSGKIQFIFAQGTEQNNVKAILQVQPGTPAGVKKILADKLLSSWKQVGRKYKALNGNNLYAYASSTINGNEIKCHVGLVNPEERIPYMSQFLGNEWSKAFGKYPEIVSNSFSGTVNAPGIVYNISGTSLNNLLEAANKVADKLKTYNGVYGTQTSYKYGKRTFDVKLKPIAYNYKLSLTDIVQQIRSGFNSEEAIKVQRGQDEVSVVLNYFHNGRDSVKYFENMKIKISAGTLIPLTEVAKITIKQTPEVIERYNGRINIQVSANVNPDIANPSKINSKMQNEFIPTIEGLYSVSFTQGGSALETQEIFNKFLLIIPLILLGIYFIITLTLQSYLQPIIVLLTIPFAAAGAILALGVLGIPISIVAIFGIAALLGIIVNDAIVMIDEINKRLKAGADYYNAVIEGTKRRFKAVMLTSLTTFFGLMPLIFNRSVMAPLFKPMAITIAFGVLFGLLINLLLTPCFLVILNDFRRIIHLYFFRKMPAREEVESAVKSMNNK